MNVDVILTQFNEHQVDYLLIGGMSFLLRHQPVLTFDVDIWIEPSAENLRRCENALAALHAEWGREESDWGAVADKAQGWLSGQSVFCLNSPHGPIDIFLSVAGLDEWNSAYQRGISAITTSGCTYRSISDRDLLQCQLALLPSEQKKDRIEYLTSKLAE